MTLNQICKSLEISISRPAECSVVRDGLATEFFVVRSSQLIVIEITTKVVISRKVSRSIAIGQYRRVNKTVLKASKGFG
jgi:hypothetical protein